MSTQTSPWEIPGADGLPIIGDAHEPADPPRGVVLIIHGFLGYKDYGMFPRIAESFADAGFVAHRFNLSHSGMTNRIETFEHPDRFERDTWNKQVFDVDAVIDQIAAGTLAGKDLPLFLLGHSRGGVTAILTAARRFHADRSPFPAGVITLSAPSQCSSATPDERRAILERGFIEVRSNRTGQTMRIDRTWLQEQIDDPEGHDLLLAAGRLRCPLLAIHGKADSTVDPRSAVALAEAAGSRGRHVLVDGGDHVFNTPNPLPPEAESSAQLTSAIEEAITLATREGRTIS